MGKRHRFRSDFELTVARKLAENGRDFEYETQKIPFQPKIKNYTPDFWFPEYGFFVEAKGKFDTADRSKHLLIKTKPDVDIRFVFQRARNKIRKNSSTSYGMWCDKHKFVWAEGSIPEEWLKNDRRYERRNKELSLWSILFNYRTYKRWGFKPVSMIQRGD